MASSSNLAFGAFSARSVCHRSRGVRSKYCFDVVRKQETQPPQQHWSVARDLRNVVRAGSTYQSEKSEEETFQVHGGFPYCFQHQTSARPEPHNTTPCPTCTISGGDCGRSFSHSLAALSFSFSEPCNRRTNNGPNTCAHVTRNLASIKMRLREVRKVSSYQDI